MHMASPQAGYREQVFYHDLPADADGWASITLTNPALGLRLTVRCWKPTLPNLIHWKQMGQGAYVVGIEPANCHVEGRAADVRAARCNSCNRANAASSRSRLI